MYDYNYDSFRSLSLFQEIQPGLQKVNKVAVKGKFFSINVLVQDPELKLGDFNKKNATRGFEKLEGS